MQEEKAYTEIQKRDTDCTLEHFHEIWVNPLKKKVAEIIKQRLLGLRK